MHPDALFEIFGKGVYLYGMFIAVGLIACVVVFYLYTKKLGMPEIVQDFSFFVTIIAIAFGFLAAKVFQAFYDFLETGTFDFYNAGITAMGGFIGGAAGFIFAYFLGGKFYFKGNKEGLHLKHFGKILLVAPCCITIAHAFGRIGCLMAGCCHGKYLGQENVFGGIYMEGTGGVWGYYVPTQLYEALFLFALFAALTILIFKYRSNIIFPVYLVAYAVWRMFIEFFRADDRGAVVLGLYPSQWQSILFVVIGIVYIVVMLKKKIPLTRPKEAMALLSEDVDDKGEDVGEDNQE